MSNCQCLCRNVCRSDHHYGYKKGIVGPVYTFVKTDYHGNFKMGVRHVAGKKYAHGRRR